MLAKWTIRRKKQAACFLAGCLLLAVYFWRSDEDMGLTMPEAAVSGQSADKTESFGKKETGGLGADGKEQQKEQAQYQKIRGMESQTTLAELRNPFSPAHEKRGEIAAVMSQEPKQPAGGQKIPRTGSFGHAGQGSSQYSGYRGSLAVPSVPDKGEGSAAKEKTAELRLSGIVHGSTPLFILTDGRESASLAVGERFNGWEVQAIGEQSVRLSGPAGEKWLNLTSFE